MIVLVTGGLGFIGSHTCIELINSGYKVIIIDNLVNSKLGVFQKINKITKTDETKMFVIDLLDFNKTEKIFQFASQNKYNIECVIHFAGLKAVSESIHKPLEYYENNIVSTLNLLKLCKKYKVNKFIFSSSATIYGTSKSPLYENSKVGNGITNPYGRTKYFIESILEDYSTAEPNMKIISLRYFNPVGSHESGLIGENPSGIPNNLMPFILKVAIKNNLDNSLDECYKELKIFGGDYDTNDGTAIRDFIHVVDLANAHVKSIERFNNSEKNYEVYNIGTGIPITVLQIVKKFIEVNNIVFPYKITDRRHGDLDVVYCNSNETEKKLKWKSMKSLNDICKDSYNFSKKSI